MTTWKEKLKAARAELKIHARAHNSAWRAVTRTLKRIQYLQDKINQQEAKAKK